jgi:membrane-associated phospholipid phosphatase
MLGLSTALVAIGATRDVDLAVTRALQAVASYPLDLVANVNTLFGQATVTTAIAALLGVVAWRRGPRNGWLAIALFGVVVLVGLLLKLALVHPPPPREFVRGLWNPLGVAIATPSGFPSGHIARLTFLVLFAAGLARETRIRVLLAAFVAYTVWARVYVGDHWASDAVGGLALGGAVGAAALAWIESRRRYDRPP